MNLPFDDKPIAINRKRLNTMIDVLNTVITRINNHASCDYNSLSDIRRTLKDMDKKLKDANDCLPNYKQYNKYISWKTKCESLLSCLSLDDTISPTYKQAKNNSFFTSNPNIQGFHPYLLFTLLDPFEKVCSFDYTALYPAIAARMFDDKMFKVSYMEKKPYDIEGYDRQHIKSVLLAYMFGASRNTIVKKMHLDVDTVNKVIEKLRETYPVITSLSRKKQDKVRHTAPQIVNKQCRELSTKLSIILIRHDQFIFKADTMPEPELFFVYDTEKRFFLHGKLETAQQIVERTEKQFFPAEEKLYENAIID